MLTMLAAVLDTCVLYSGLRRDFLLSLVAAGTYRLVLTEDILYEIEYVEARKLTARGIDHVRANQRAAHLVNQLRTNFEVECDSRVEIVAPVGLPDPGDEHLVAAAIAGGAEVIVTENIRDLPAALLPTGIRTLHPREFLHDMVCADPHNAARVLAEMTSRRQSPPQSETDMLGLLVLRENLHPTTADALRPFLPQRSTRT